MNISDLQGLSNAMRSLTCSVTSFRRYTITIKNAFLIPKKKKNEKLVNKIICYCLNVLFILKFRKLI